MKALVVGYSSIARRRVLPALHAAGIDEIHLATSRLVPVPEPVPGVKLVFGSYAEGIEQSDAEIVYISLVNSAHFEYAKMALERGKHVVVDKPICLTQSEAKTLVDLAAERRLLVSEAVVYQDHPRLTALRSYVETKKLEANHISANFSFPPFPEGNFRNSAAYGGGACLDLGPYCVTPGRLFFGSTPVRIDAQVLCRGSEVDMAFAVLFVYPNGKSFVGRFGFDSEYENSMLVLGSGYSCRMDRVFTPPPDYSERLIVRQDNQQIEVPYLAGDAFAHYLRRVLALIPNREFSSEYASVREDSQVMERLRLALKEAA